MIHSLIGQRVFFSASASAILRRYWCARWDDLELRRLLSRTYEPKLHVESEHLDGVYVKLQRIDFLWYSGIFLVGRHTPSGRWTKDTLHRSTAGLGPRQMVFPTLIERSLNHIPLLGSLWRYSPCFDPLPSAPLPEHDPRTSEWGLVLDSCSMRIGRPREMRLVNGRSNTSRDTVIVRGRLATTSQRGRWIEVPIREVLWRGLGDRLPITPLPTRIRRTLSVPSRSIMPRRAAPASPASTPAAAPASSITSFARGVGPSSALAWTRAQRKRLNGLRYTHKNDPAAIDLGADAWEKLVAWDTSCQAIPRFNMAERRYVAMVDAIWSSYASAKPPATSTGDIETARLHMLIYELRAVGEKLWEHDLLGVLVPFWASSFGVKFVLDLTRFLPSFASHGNLSKLAQSEIIFEHDPSVARSSEGPGQVLLGYGNRHAFWAALRRYLFSLDDDAFAAALVEGAAFRASLDTWDSSYRVQLLFDVAYAFSRDPSWATAHVVDLVDPDDSGWRRSLSCSPDLLLPSIVDPALALAYIKHFPSWPDTHRYNFIQLLDIVESIGPDASRVLRAFPMSHWKTSAIKPVEEAIALSES